MKSLKNPSASVKQRLLNRARRDKRPFEELLQYYAMERFLYRLSQSVYAQNYILKGAFMLRVWNSPEYRTTKDIDMLVKKGNEAKNITSHIRDILTVEVEPDGLVFNKESIRTDRISEEANYEGIRVRFRGLLNTARINLQLDIGFGDIVYPKPKKEKLPCILDSPTPILLCYSRESVIAEKFEAMVKLGHMNSRIKDFYDIWLLSRQFKFEFRNLDKAIRLTFKQRGTKICEPIDAFSTDFISYRQIMWKAFIKRLQQEHVSESFQEIALDIEEFLKPVIKGNSRDMIWTPAGSWS